MSARPDRRGFALPLAVLALALITATVVAAFAATNAETVANNALRAQNHAYQLAEAGLQQFMLRRSESGFCTNCVSSPPPTDSEWTRVSLPGGYATVVATRLRAQKSDGTPALFLVRSTGVDTMVRMSGAGRLVFAIRTVGLFATFGTSPLRSLGSWTSFNGITQNGSRPAFAQSSIEGNDACFSGDRAGAVVPPGQWSGTGEAPFGSPAINTSMTLDSLKLAIGVDWNAIKNHDAIPADYTIPPQSWPSSFGNWPVIRLKGNFSVPGSGGKGTLIADNDLTISSNYGWQGIILVGGKLTASGTGTISGAIVTGLNRMLPGAPADVGTTDNDLNSNRNWFRYNSCDVERAAQRLDTYFALTNTWMDNIAVW